MRIYYKVCFTKGNRNFTKRFEGEDFDKAVEFMNRTNGTLHSCKEKIRWRLEV